MSYLTRGTRDVVGQSNIDFLAFIMPHTDRHETSVREWVVYYSDESPLCTLASYIRRDTRPNPVNVPLFLCGTEKIEILHEKNKFLLETAKMSRRFFWYNSRKKKRHFSIDRLGKSKRWQCIYHIAMYFLAANVSNFCNARNTMD